MQTVRTAAAIHGDAATAEFVGFGAWTAGQVGDSLRTFDEAFASWLELARYYYGERYRDRPLHQMLGTVDNSDAAILALRAGIPAEALSTDVLLEFHLCCCGFLSGRMPQLLREHGHHLQSLPALARHLGDFALKNVLLIIRVETAGFDHQAATELLVRNHDDFEIKARYLVSGVDTSFAGGFRKLDALAALALRARFEPRARPAGQLAQLHHDARELFGQTPYRPLATLADLAYAVTANASRSTTSRRAPDRLRHRTP